MSKAQTIFSELCVASAIADTAMIEDIENVDEMSIVIYQKELLARKGKASIGALVSSGMAIREYLLGNGVTPKRVVWTGKQNIGATVAVAKDIEVANYRISVKENANVFINGSPITVFEDMPSGLFGIKRKGDDWFLKVARGELQEYFLQCKACAKSADGFETIEDFYKNTDKKQRKAFGTEVASLHKEKNKKVLLAYSALCNKVSAASADIFNSKLADFRKINPSVVVLQPIFHYFFRINGIKYILAGTEKNKPFAVVLESSSDWTKSYQFLGITATPKTAGQPEVLLSFKFKKTTTKEEFTVDLKIEVRWSHGKFCGNPEAKIYKTWSYSALPWAENICL
jgi:hypothetical protein